jgi:protein TonB
VTAAQIAAAQREPAARSRAVSEGDRLAQQLRQRLVDGRLVAPPNDSAAHFLQQLRSAEPAHPAIEEASTELASRLLDEAAAAARGGQRDAAREQLALARQFGADAAAVRGVEQLLAPRPQSASGYLLVPHEKLKRTRASAPDYPEDASRRGMPGRVVLRFVVNTRGEPQDLAIVSEEPKGVFGKAALAAVRRWRYEPYQVDGQAVPVETAVNIRFTPEQ